MVSDDRKIEVANDNEPTPGPFDVQTVKLLVQLMSRHDLSEIDLREGRAAHPHPPWSAHGRRGCRGRFRLPPIVVAAPSVAPTANSAPPAEKPAARPAT